jgi:hypothetical protein
MKYLILFLILLAGCKKPIEKKLLKSPKTSDELVLVNRSDEIYYQVPDDTITKDGWKIEYLTKNDSTKYHDIYIKASKGNITKISFHPDVLDYRGYFIPSYTLETNKYILFEHGCATNCSAVTVVPKDVSNKPIEFNWVLKYDLELSTIVYVDDITFAAERVTINAFNLNINIDKSVTFNNRCISTSSHKCIDKVVIKNKKVELTGWFNDDYGNNSIKETQTIRF